MKAYGRSSARQVTMVSVSYAFVRVARASTRNSAPGPPRPRAYVGPSILIPALAFRDSFRENGTVTAGNASGVNDVAAALYLASEKAARDNGLTPRARILGMATAGVEPRLMGIGPVPATLKLLDRLRLSLNDFDLIELNEAFAAQVLACLAQLGVEALAPHVNPHGGAIALGHPLGMSGARLAITAGHGLERTGGRRALVTMCVGVGQGVSLSIERV